MILSVNTGDVKVGRGKTVLRASAIGSCIVVVAYDKVRRVGGMAHVMLPGCAPDKKKRQETRYAEDAIDILLKRLKGLGASAGDLAVCLVGAGNVLKRPEDTVCQSNIDSVLDIIKKKNLNVVSQDLGGHLRRSATLDIAEGKLYRAQGDDPDSLLWGY